MMEYKGYTGRITGLDEEQRLFHGRVVLIRDVITFEGATVDEVVQAFRDSVEDYLEFCRERGEAPERAIPGASSTRTSASAR